MEAVSFRTAVAAPDAVVRSLPRGVPARLALFWAISGLYAGVLFAWSALRHANYGSHAFDLAAYHQTFHNLGAHGSLWSPIERFHSWSSHLEVGLLPLGLAYRISPSPLWLFALQAAACAACGLPIEALARRVTGDARLALLCGTATLLTPQLVFANIDDFHSVTLCAFPMAIMVVGIEMDAALAVVVGALLALSLREQMGLAVAAAGLGWMVVRGRRRARAGAALVALGLAVFFVEVLVVIPSFANDGAFRHIAGNYDLGSTPREILANALHDPLRFALLPFQGRRRLVYPIALSSGAALLVLVALVRAPRRAAAPLLMLAPLLLVQLYSARVIVFSVESQYGAPLVPLVGACAVLGVGALAKPSAALGLGAASGWLLVTSLHALISIAPLATRPGGPLDPSFRGSPRASGLAHAVASIPQGSVVSAQDAITPHLAGDVHMWPDGEGIAELVVLDANVGAGTDVGESVKAAEERLRRDPRFEVIVDEAGVLLVERRGVAR